MGASILREDRDNSSWIAQADGMRPSAPIYSFGKGTRDQMDKIFLSAHAEKIKGNRDTPGARAHGREDLA